MHSWKKKKYIKVGREIKVHLIRQLGLGQHNNYNKLQILNLMILPTRTQQMLVIF